jgi:two-component system NtrC family sensor kinase
VTRLDADKIATPMARQWRTRTHAQYERIRTRLRWQMLAGYVTPLIVLSVFFHLQYDKTLKEGIHNHLKSIADNQRNTVDLFLQERVANLRRVSRPGFFLGVPPATTDMEAILRSLQAESTTFVDVGLFSPDGLLAAYVGPYPQLEGKNYSGESWWRQLMKQKREYLISDVYLGFRGRPHFIVALRRIIDGEPWVIRASVDPEKFGEFVGSHHLSDEAETFIVNAKGQRQTLAAGEESDETIDVPPRSSETAITRMGSGRRSQVAAIAWLVENDWALVVRVPSARANAPLVRARILLVSIMLLTLGLIVALVVRFTRRLVGRLEEADVAKEHLRGQLFNAAKLASVGEMAAGVAHEINNPLAIIYEEAGIMRDMMDPELGGKVDLDEFNERLKAISEAAMRGRTITRKLMAFARQHDPVLEPTSLHEIMDKVVVIKETEFRVSNIEVVREYADGVPDLLINRNQMEQVLLNLLNNAKDAMDGPGTITLRTRLEGEEVHLDVEDTGCGMTEEQIEKAFFPFYTTKDVGKGTGLGLSISYGIVKSFGGRIEVQSSVGSGTTFTIVLPASPVNEKAEARPAADARRGAHV